jgi:hypothetical protein
VLVLDCRRTGSTIFADPTTATTSAGLNDGPVITIFMPTAARERGCQSVTLGPGGKARVASPRSGGVLGITV